MDNQLELTARCYNSLRLKEEGLFPLFKAIKEFGFFSLSFDGEEEFDPVIFYTENQDEDYFILKLADVEFIMTPRSNSGRVIFTTILDSVDEKKNSTILGKFSNFFDSLFSFLNCSFAYIDLEGDSPSSLKTDIENIRIQWLFWTVYFGESYVEKYGLNFLLGAPLWKTERLTHGVKYVTREYPGEDITKKMFEMIREYFKPVDTIQFYSLNRFGYK